jgi:hypothetical protein
MDYIEIEKNGYNIHEIREIEFPYLNIWPLMTTSFLCSGDGKGRSRLLLIDSELEKVMGLYLGGGTSTHDFVVPLSEDISRLIEEKIPWKNYKK